MYFQKFDATSFWMIFCLKTSKNQFLYEKRIRLFCTCYHFVNWTDDFDFYKKTDHGFF